MTSGAKYGSPAAFRRALTDQLRSVATRTRWSPLQLQRQIAYDRLLERLYRIDDGWIVKGATALLARDLGVRATIDVDIYRARARDVAEAEFRAAVASDIGDWFRFEVGPGRVIGDGQTGVRLPVKAFVGDTEWASFHVDLVGSDLRMTGGPEMVPALARVAIRDVEQHGYRAYPLVDHVADKVVAMYQRYGDQRRPSTRYKDLVDLVAIVDQASVGAAAQLRALATEADRRGVVLPGHFSAPDRELWERGYAAEAARSLLTRALNLDDALEVVGAFVDPLLDGSAGGAWAPNARGWRS